VGRVAMIFTVPSGVALYKYVAAMSIRQPQWLTIALLLNVTT
jgi:hypothetical protein